MEIKLTVYDNSNRSLAKRLALPCIIGRSRVSSFPVPDPLVSRRHCEIFADNTGVMLKDLDSLNGTFLGGQRIKTVVPLKNGEIFSIGDYRFCISEVTEEDRRNLELSEPKNLSAYDSHQSVPTVSSLDGNLRGSFGASLGNENNSSSFLDKRSQPFSAAPQPFGAASQPFSAAPQPFGAASQPFGAAPQPFGVASQPFGAASQPFGDNQKVIEEELQLIDDDELQFADDDELQIADDDYKI